MIAMLQLARYILIKWYNQHLATFPPTSYSGSSIEVIAY